MMNRDEALAIGNAPDGLGLQLTKGEHGTDRPVIPALRQLYRGRV